MYTRSTVLSQVLPEMQEPIYGTCHERVQMGELEKVTRSEN